MQNTLAEGWQAQLTLGFSRSGQRTVLGRRRHSGPLQVQKPFYPEADGACHVYILHPPGGVVAGDDLRVNIVADSNTHVLLTTPAATKFYRSSGPKARQVQQLQLAHDAALEWLPQETIVYEGAQVDTTTRVELSGNARFIGWEILCLGRPAANERYTNGVCRQRFEVWRDGTPLFLERGRYIGNSELLQAHWGLQQQPVTATLVCTIEQAGLAAALREALMTMETALLSVSQLTDVLVCRYLGPSVEQAKAWFTQAWSLLRTAILGKPACPPRIWNT